MPQTSLTADLHSEEIYWREASAGHSKSAYFVGKALSTLPRIAISAIHFTTLYCALATPLMDFWPMYLTIVLYFYCTSLVFITTRATNPFC